MVVAQEPSSMGAPARLAGRRLAAAVLSAHALVALLGPAGTAGGGGGGRQVRWFVSSLAESLAMVQAHPRKCRLVCAVSTSAAPATSACCRRLLPPPHPRHASRLAGSLTGLYPGFSAAGVHDNGTFFPSPAGGSSTRRDRQASLPCDTQGNLLAPYVWATTFRRVKRRARALRLLSSADR